ncbi:MAG: B12-binding domain-containing radical SAM protein [Methanomassiliicoccales archaeon]
MPRVVLTADRTLMSEYNGEIFMGFAACAPNFLPGWLYRKIFCPPVRTEGGRALTGHCGQRKLEAALLESGLDPEDVVVASPEELEEVMDQDTEVLCITTHDPLGLGPASTTFTELVGRETYSSYYFRGLMGKKVLRKVNPTIIVGGSGAWQLADERLLMRMRVDTVVLGEGEITGVEMVHRALNGEELPRIVQGEVAPKESIPLIKGPTICGLVEICRGCGRGCDFCNPTMMNFRCLPVESIIKEVKLNVGQGNGIVLHAEDVLRYRARGPIPDREAVTELFSRVKEVTGNIRISHFAHSSAACSPELIEELSGILELGSTLPFISGQVGIESGSPRMMEEHMKGKTRPFSPQEWPEMVVQSHQLLRDNRWIPVNTLIAGFPGERPEDLEMTKELVQDLWDYRSMVVPLHFVPLGTLQETTFFRSKNAPPEYWMLLAACLRHNFHWMYDIMEEHRGFPWAKGWRAWAVPRVVKRLENRLRPYLEEMEEGRDPRRQTL